MTRPAYVIGLGGSGQWVLTYLKSELMEINKGVMPREVKLLGIDTQIQSVQLAQAGQAQIDPNKMATLTDARVGDVRLDPGTEFVQIGGPLFQFIQQMNQHPEPYMDWLDTTRLLQLGDSACNTTWGAGAFRQLGRLSLFKSVNNVYAKLRQDLQNLSPIVSSGTGASQLEIHLVGSIAGGTGAGTMLDVAWLIRAVAESINFQNYVLRGFIVLPTAFEQQGPDNGKRLRAYAAWKELDRFMSSQVLVKGATQIIYNPNSNPPIIAKCDTNIFDTTYLIDQNRNTNSLINYRPENATFPVVAHSISLILDDQSGANFAAHVPNVHMGGALTLPPGVYHSSFGAFTIKAPVHFLRSQLARELTFASLEKLVEPMITDIGIGTGVRSDRNEEVQPNDIPSGAKLFLTSERHGSISNNALLPHVNTVSQKGLEAGTYATREATSIVDRRGETFQALTTQIHNPDLKRSVDELKNAHVWDFVKPSLDRNTTPAKNKPELINGINLLDIAWFGQKSFKADPANPAVQIEVRTSEGSKVKVLREVSEYLVDSYRAFLRDWSNIQLNGIDASPSVARCGKIGYVLAVYAELVQRFTEYEAYLVDLQQRINLNKTKQSRIQSRDNALQAFNRNAGKEHFLAFFDDNVHPKAREAERDYLRRVDKVFEYYLAEFLIEKSKETVAQMKTFTLESAKRLNLWVQLLVTGRQEGDPQKRYTGLYNYMWEMVQAGSNGLELEKAQGNPNFGHSHQLQGVQQIIQTTIAQQHYQNNDRAAQYQMTIVKVKPYNAAMPEMEEILGQFHWEVMLQPGGGCLDYRCGFKESANTIRYLENGDNQSSVHTNYSLWLSKSQSHFNSIADETRLSTALPVDFPNPENLADEIADWAAPMYFQAFSHTGQYDSCLFTRVDGSMNLPYFDAFTKRLTDIAAPRGGWIVNPNVAPGHQNSQDPFKMTIFRANHLMPSKDFQLMQDLENLFVSTMNNPQGAADPVQNFIFSAEKNAHKYASMKPLLLKQNYSPFDPEVVGLLQDESKLLLFFLAYAQGMLVRIKGTNKDNFGWQVDQLYPDEKLHLVEPNTGLAQSQRTPSIFDVVRFWVVGKDCRETKKNVLQMDWSKLEQLVTEKERLEKTQVKKAYQIQADGVKPDTLVAIIEEDKNIQYNLIATNMQKFFQPARYKDLQDLARIAYMKRISDIF